MKHMHNADVGVHNSSDLRPHIINFSIHAEVHRELSKTAEMCRKVKAALSNIEQRRDKFAHIDDRELDRRKESVDRLDKVRPSSLNAPRCCDFSRVLRAAFVLDPPPPVHNVHFSRCRCSCT